VSSSRRILPSYWSLLAYYRPDMVKTDAMQAIAHFMSTPLEERLTRDRQVSAQGRVLQLFRRSTLRSSGDPEYFPAGVKHRYTRN
jgi:hypothetical protein